MSHKLKLNPSKLKPPKNNRRNMGSPWMYVCFRSDEDRQKALEVLNNFEWKKKTLSAQLADACPDPLVKRRLEEDQEANPKKPKLAFESQDEALKHSVVPLCNLPYEKQVQSKEDKAREILRNISTQLSFANKDLTDHLKEQKEKFNGMPCEFLGVRTAHDRLEGYRNKCEFTIGLDENKRKTVGFRLGTYAQGTKLVAPIPPDLVNVPEEIKQAVWLFEKYVQNSSLDIYDPEHHSGHWRMLTVRKSFAMNQLMLIVQVDPQSLSEDEILKLQTDLVDYFTIGEGKSCNPTSIYFQTHCAREDRKNKKSSYKLIYGESVILEKLRGLTFEISPDSFFQVNVAGAELLYEAVGDLAQVNPSTSVLDVCCGAGTIGLSLAQNAKWIFGLDIDTDAIEDATRNGKRNNVSNCSFFSGRAEQILSSVLMRGPDKHEDIVAIVDPPRAGLHRDAVAMLRKTEKLNKLVYLSCNPTAKSVMENFVALCRPPSKTLQNNPFFPRRAVVVDMFPHTPHFELVVYFERLDDSTLLMNENNLTANLES
ncbi:tRNA (uracil-5-)-methyltransferase homolog A isoform X2 [Bemisia tabaci]